MPHVENYQLWCACDLPEPEAAMFPPACQPATDDVFDFHTPHDMHELDVRAARPGFGEAARDLMLAHARLKEDSQKFQVRYPYAQEVEEEADQALPEDRRAALEQAVHDMRSILTPEGRRRALGSGKAEATPAGSEQFSMPSSIALRSNSRFTAMITRAGGGGRRADPVASWRAGESDGEEQEAEQLGELAKPSGADVTTDASLERGLSQCDDTDEDLLDKLSACGPGCVRAVVLDGQLSDSEVDEASNVSDDPAVPTPAMPGMREQKIGMSAEDSAEEAFRLWLHARLGDEGSAALRRLAAEPGPVLLGSDASSPVAAPLGDGTCLAEAALKDRARVTV